jgi:hypothetical protein
MLPDPRAERQFWRVGVLSFLGNCGMDCRLIVLGRQDA